MASAIYEINKYFNTNQIFALVLPPHLEIHAQVINQVACPLYISCDLHKQIVADI